MTDYELEVINEMEQECLQSDPVYRAITYVGFVSKSKGRGRKRRNWKEIKLLKYNGNFHLWHNFPFDVYASEILGYNAYAVDLQNRITDIWG